MRTLSLLLLVCSLLVCSLLPAQDASIIGTTVHAVTGQPIGGVHITVFPLQANTGLANAYGAISDKSGRFSIPSLPGGTYFCTGELSGFLSTLKVPSSIPFAKLFFKPGEHVQDLKLEMAPLSVIAGRVLDEFGQPVMNLRVEVESALSDHAMSAVPRSAMQTTDDRGEFRYIVGPGKYKVKASSVQTGNASPEIRDGVLQTEYPTIYYPGGADPERASIVEVGPGDMAIGLEIHMSRPRGIVLTGTVSGIPPKAQLAVVYLRFGADANTFQGMKTARVSTDGKFVFTGLSPNFYSISASSGGEDIYLESPTIMQRFDGDTTIDLALSAGFELTGKVVLPPGFPPASLKIRLIASSQFIAESPGADIEKDGGFHLKRVFPSKLHVKLAPLPDTAYVSSVALDGSALPGEEFDLGPGGSKSILKITVATDGGTLTGHILDKDGERITGSAGAVFLVKNKDEANNDRNTAQIKPDGTYSFKSIPPGKYLLFGFDYVRYGAEGSMSSIMKVAVKSAVEIEIKSNGNATADVRAAVREPPKQ